MFYKGGGRVRGQILFLGSGRKCVFSLSQLRWGRRVEDPDKEADFIRLLWDLCYGRVRILLLYV